MTQILVDAARKKTIHTPETYRTVDNHLLEDSRPALEILHRFQLGREATFSHIPSIRMEMLSLVASSVDPSTAGDSAYTMEGERIQTFDP